MGNDGNYVLFNKGHVILPFSFQIQYVKRFSSRSIIDELILNHLMDKIS